MRQFWHRRDEDLLLGALVAIALVVLCVLTVAIAAAG